MRPRLFFKFWLLALTLCDVFLGVLCSVPAQAGDGGEPSVASLRASLNRKDVKGTELAPDPLSTLLVLASLDGTLTAVDRVSGELRWVSKDEPMIKVPASRPSEKAPYFLPDPKTGSIYVMRKTDYSLTKLPFTIPEFVAKAPCRSSEGLLYTGKKMDSWLTLNPYTGDKAEMLSYGECPAKHDDPSGSCKAPHGALPGSSKKPLLIGKTEYTLSIMVDGPRKWNVTYNHYSSVDMSPQSAKDYELVHFTSPSTGAVLTYSKRGDLLWQRELESPVIAVYTVDYTLSHFISVPFNPIAPETLNRLKSDASQDHLVSSTTYIGKSNYGRYAVPALVDSQVVVLKTNDGKTSLPPLLEGPSIDGTTNDTPSSNDHKSEDGNLSNNSHDPQGNSEDDDIFVGYYENPESTRKPPVRQIGSSSLREEIPKNPNSLPPGQFNESEGNADFIPPESYSNDNLEFLEPVSLNTDTTTKVHFPLFPIPTQTPPITPANPEPKKINQEKPFKIVFTTAVISMFGTSLMILVGMITYRKYKARKTQKLSNVNRNKDKVSDSEEETHLNIPVTKKPKTSADGSEVTIGKISFSPMLVLGKGCEGTFVYKGKFEGRDVAVKRILPECFAFADREVDLLKESDQHANVIRYFCTEADGQFRYIALELCDATLSDWIEGKFNSTFIDPIQILREATDGLAHLHSLRIVHRDIKPANVLLSMPASGGTVRTMISDFGLCKKITNGRMSFSRRSGGILGTDGWIAPEVIKNMNKEPQRMSYSVDVFSLGCVFYFVLTNGDHPYGEPFRRQSNIVNGDYELQKLSRHAQGAYDLIKLMISPEASERPPLSDVLTHPIFWSKEKILTFFLDVSDRIEKEDESKCVLLRKLESDGTRIVRDDWRDHICPEVAMDLRKYRTYKGQSVRDLLRALRNKKNHYRELTPEAQASLGHIPDQFVDYWVTRFPDLLPYSWLKFESVRYEPIFTKYYPKSYSFNSSIIGDADMLLEAEFEDLANEENDEGKLNPRTNSPEKSPSKVDKNFWRSKSQFKYNKWRRQQQVTNVRENPHNFVSYGTTRYPPNNEHGENVRTPDTDSSWRNPLPKAPKDE